LGYRTTPVTDVLKNVLKGFQNAFERGAVANISDLASQISEALAKAGLGTFDVGICLVDRAMEMAVHVRVCRGAGVVPTGVQTGCRELHLSGSGLVIAAEISLRRANRLLNLWEQLRMSVLRAQSIGLQVRSCAAEVRILARHKRALARQARNLLERQAALASLPF
jgi:hypothetical protein